MRPEEDARAILRLALRHEHSLAASLDPAFAQENWGFLAQQCVENLLKGFMVLADGQPPLSQDLERLQQLAGVSLPEDLLGLGEFAVEARDSPQDTPLPASRERLLAEIRHLREEFESQIQTRRPNADAPDSAQPFNLPLWVTISTIDVQREPRANG
jgi:HEPN domain-containing protein